MAASRDLVIIGGGAGGLVVASVAAQLGLDVVLINKQSAMGGDCLHYGCVPSKTLLKSASVANMMRHADRWGLIPVNIKTDMLSVNRTIKKAIDTLQVHDSRERFEALGCEVITGEANFTSPSQVEVEGRRIDAKRFVIATGSSVFIPPLNGLEQTAYLTNEDMFSLPALPESLIILGGGPVGVEMAQAYCRLGSKVTIVEVASRLISRMDTDASTILAETLNAEGISIYLNSEVAEVSAQGSLKQLVLKDGTILQAESLLLAIGRRPVVDCLNLEAADVAYDDKGIRVNRKMQTTNKRIFACGDVTGEMPLTHVAELQAGIVIANMIFKLPKKVSYDVIPSVVYTDPEVAQVGVSVEQCKSLKHGEVHKFKVSQLDRAITDNNKTGVAKILTNKGRIIGAHITAPHAGELIHELALAVQEKMKISKITSLVHAYPSYSQLNKRLAGQYYTDRLFSPLIKKLVSIIW
jgi:pyruvate/2-oxoglutarate dehydrogenase complex dihydrolipoamide dehydrogenase (E3) component